jgi:transcriptional regulator with XRE-family HTH domain
MHLAEPTRLRELRSLKRLSQEALADALSGDIDRSTISRWETGESEIPLERVRELAAFFHVSTTWLLRWEADPWETSNGNGDVDGDGERVERAA